MPVKGGVDHRFFELPGEVGFGIGDCCGFQRGISSQLL